MDEQLGSGEAACKCHTWTLTFDDFEQTREGHHPLCEKVNPPPAVDVDD